MYGKEMAEKLMKKEIAARRDFASKEDAMIAVAEKFNGKVFTKRFETAMSEAYPCRIEMGYTFGWLEFKFYVADRMVQSDTADKYGYRSTAYIRNDNFRFISQNALNADKRIIAENVIESIKKEIRYYRESADKLERELATIDTIIAEHGRILKEMAEYNRNISGTTQEYFDLRL